MATLRLSIVTETFPPEVNGVAMTVGRLVEGMQARGHQIQLVRPRQRGEARPGAPVAGGEPLLAVRGFPLPGYPELRFGLPAKGAMVSAWRRDRPDAVHVVTEGPLGWSAVAAARQLGIPVTSGFHTNFDRYSVHYGLGFLRPTVAAYLRSFHRRTRATLVPTESLAADLAGEGIPGVKVVGRGVDTTLFDPARRSDTLRGIWGAGAEDLVCLYVGRVAPEKNLKLVLAAFSAIRARLPGARMVWVGDGPARAGLATAYPDHHFAGARVGVDLATHYASGDLFLFPSLTETYGNVVAEAMASGLPVVAYKSAAAAELIHDGVNGNVAPPGDEASFVEAAVAMAQAESALRLTRGGEARATMLSRGWERVVERFEAVVREAVAAG